MADAHSNFAYSTVATAPSPASSGTSLIVATGTGSLFPSTPFNATVWPVSTQPTSTNAEVVTVTNISSDTLTITRAQEGSSARTIIVGDQIAATITNKTLTDIENVIAVTALSYQNRQLGASVQSAVGQNSLWITPFRIPVGMYISASSFVMMQSFTGTFTSNASARWGETIRWGFYTANATNSTRLDSWTSGSITAQLFNSSSTSISFDWDGVTTSSNNSNLASRITGVRIIPEVVNTVFSPGLNAFAFAISTSSLNYSALIRTYGVVMDNPMAVGLGTIGQATNGSLGYADAGVYTVTTGGIPSSIGLNEIKQTMNAVPYIKIGAI